MFRITAAALVTLLIGAPATAGIKLITLPARERVEIQLDHLSATLVEEERVVPLAAGVNDVVFAWANTSIDPSSIQLRCLTDPEHIQVLSVSYPPNEQALTWQVASPQAGSARMRISYIIGRLDKSFAYRATAAHDERSLTLRQYVLLHNNANETFGIAGMHTGFGARLERPIEVNETKRLLSAKFTEVPVTKTYTADLAEFGYLDAATRQLRIPMHYVLRNDEAGGLGAFALMPGKARIFQDDGHGTVAFVGEDWAPFTPRDDEMRLYLGVSKDIVVTRTIERSKRVRVMGQLHDLDVVVKYEFENFKDQPVVVDLAETLHAVRAEAHTHSGRPVHWELGPTNTLGAPDEERSTADRPVFHVSLPARGADDAAVSVEHRLHVIFKNEW